MLCSLFRFTEYPPKRSPPNRSCSFQLIAMLSAFEYRFCLASELDQLLVLFSLFEQLSPFSIQPLDFTTEFFGIFTALYERAHRFGFGFIPATVTR